MFEWFSSPIVYRQTDFSKRIAPLLVEYFTPQTSIYRYLGTTNSNYAAFLREKESIKAKKYFYILRPLLAFCWIMDRNCPPSMLFSDLTESYLDKSVEKEISYLLDIEMNTLERQTIPLIPSFDTHICRLIEETDAYLSSQPKKRQGHGYL